MLKRIAVGIILGLFTIGLTSCCKGHCWLNPTRADNCCHKEKGCCHKEKVYDSNCPR